MTENKITHSCVSASLTRRPLFRQCKSTAKDMSPSVSSEGLRYPNYPFSQCLSMADIEAEMPLSLTLGVVSKALPVAGLAADRWLLRKPHCP